MTFHSDFPQKGTPDRNCSGCLWFVMWDIKKNKKPTGRKEYLCAYHEHFLEDSKGVCDDWVSLADKEREYDRKNMSNMPQ